MSPGFVCNHLVLVHAELDRKGYVNMVIGIREDKFLGFISEKKTPNVYSGLTSFIIVGIKTQTTLIYFMYFD